MPAITTRQTAGTGATVKNSPLTNAEIDNNFIAINNEIYVDGYINIKPSLSLDFINAGVLDPRITFTRTGGGATRFNSSGVLETVSADVPRFDYDPITREPRGLLIEGSRTNFFTNASGNSGGSFGTGTVLGPDNVLCRTFIPTAGARSYPNVTGTIQSFSLTSGQTIDWAISGWFAAGPEGTPTLEPMLVFNVSVDNTTSFIYATIQINTSTWTVRSKFLSSGLSELSAPTITLFKPGLYRVTWVVRYTQDATIRNNVTASIQARDTAGNGIYTADGVSGVQYALVQAETGSFVTSTIPTTTGAVTRNADVASVNNLSPWFNSTEGTIYVEASTFDKISANRLYVLNDGSLNNQIRNSVNGATLFDSAPIESGGTAVVLGGGSVILNTVYKRAVGYKINDAAYVRNGLLLSTSSSINIPSGINNLRLGSDLGFGYLNGYIRRITYYPRRLSNTELQVITK